MSDESNYAWDDGVPLPETPPVASTPRKSSKIQDETALEGLLARTGELMINLHKPLMQKCNDRPYDAIPLPHHNNTLTPTNNVPTSCEERENLFPHRDVNPETI